MSSSSSRGVTRRGFLTVAVSAIVAGVIAGVGAYYAGTLAAPVKEVVKEVTKTVTTTTTLAPGAPTTITVTPPPTTITKTVTTTVTVTPTRKSIRVGLDAVGTAGNMIGSLVADFMRSVFPTYDISTYPLGGIIGSTKEFLKGGLEVTFSTATSLKLLYAREEWFKDVPEDTLLPVHTLYTHSSEAIIVTTPELKEKYRLNSWKDLDGKKVTFHTARSENHLWYIRALKANGVNVKQVEIDLDMIADALRKGDIVATLFILVVGLAPPFIQNIATKMKTVIIPPSTEEMKVVEKAGLPFTWFPTKRFKEYGVDVLDSDEAFGLVLAPGFNTHPKFLSEDDVYRLLKEMINKRDELAKMAAYLRRFAEDPIGLQVTAISTAPEIPVHPGLAKLLKEHGVWRGEWKIAS